jgi:S1-C subfamily serine protease
MFKGACQKNRDSIYGIRAFSQISTKEVNNGMGSGFTIAPGIIATVAHLVHVENNPKKQIHTNFEVIRSPDIGLNMEAATFIAEDPNHDIAFLKINTPRSSNFLTLELNKVSTGTNCGSLGFPLGELTQLPQGIQIGLIERFQGSYISAFRKALSPSGHLVDFYEIDSLMYNGSSGCPGFLVNSNVIGMQSQSLLGQSAADQANLAKGRKINTSNTQLAISMWVPSMDIIKCAQNNGITV